MPFTYNRLSLFTVSLLLINLHSFFMTIKLTHKQQTRRNLFQRYIIEDNLLLWYVHCTNGQINHIRERLYQTDKDDIVYEKVINDLPTSVLNAFNQFIQP